MSPAVWSEAQVQEARDAMAVRELHRPGRYGEWSIDLSVQTPEATAAEQLTARARGHNRWVPPGEYMRLRWGNSTVMSDTPQEIEDHFLPYEVAQQLGGRCLVHGFGLGAIVKGLLTLPQVEHVDVVELRPEVLMLALPPFAGDLASGRLTVHVGDAYTLLWPAMEDPRPVHRPWTMVWHDIWFDISPMNLQGMDQLETRFERYCEWQACWARQECEAATEWLASPSARYVP